MQVVAYECTSHGRFLNASRRVMPCLSFMFCVVCCSKLKLGQYSCTNFCSRYDICELLASIPILCCSYLGFASCFASLSLPFVLQGMSLYSIACTNVVLQLVGFGFGYRNTAVDWLEA